MSRRKRNSNRVGGVPGGEWASRAGALEGQGHHRASDLRGVRASRGWERTQNRASLRPHCPALPPAAAEKEDRAGAGHRRLCRNWTLRRWPDPGWQLWGPQAREKGRKLRGCWEVVAGGRLCTWPPGPGGCGGRMVADLLETVPR